MDCEVCGHKIPKARIRALPSTTTCVKCSVEEANIGVIMTGEGSDGIDVQISKPGEEMRKLK
jgi:hypothetical protein